MIELTPERMSSLYHPYYLETFREDDIAIERYLIKPNEKVVATVRVNRLAFDKSKKKDPYFSGLLATRCLHQLGFMYLAWAYDKSKIAFFPRGFSFQFKEFITKRAFVVILHGRRRESKSGKTLFEVTADFDDGKLTASATIFGFPKSKETCYSQEYMLTLK